MNTTTADNVVVSDIPPRFRWACEVGAATLPASIRAEADRVLGGIKSGDRPRGILLQGTAGTGKTTAAVVVLAELRRLQSADGGPPFRVPGGRFVSDGDVIRKARAAFEGRGAQSFEGFLDGLVERRNLVVLDDLAAGLDQPYTAFEARVLGDCVDTLYRSMQPTIITTNKSLDELGRVFGDRVPSRLFEMAVHVVLDGGDRRIAQVSA